MRIYGIGTDIVEVDRIKKLIKNKTLLKRIFEDIVLLGISLYILIKTKIK